ncbi:hypothetical protein [Shewanella youngdeokensis]|uniref:Porin n=1 Tax=Shewanella youngdeokensis TaxID=2999068 RepID=A0ABZ0K276_9GAMM|nr:hypothetical protein RGE70_07710 [Shewanella sp. DAU334]
MKKIALLLMTLAPLSMAQAEVLKQNTSVGIGYRANIGSAVEDDSNMNEYLVLKAKHKTITDWGSITIAGRMENPFGLTAEKPSGKDAAIAYKTFIDTYYNLGSTNIQFWWNEFSVSNQNIGEFTNAIGFAYAPKLGKLKAKIAVAAPYTVSHSPLRNYDGMLSAAMTRVEAAYPIAKGAVVFGMLDSNWDRKDGYRETFGYGETHGHHLVIGGNYKISQSFKIALLYHNYQSWGGYAQDGQVIETSINYVF